VWPVSRAARDVRAKVFTQLYMEQSARCQELDTPAQLTGGQPYSDEFMMYVFKVG